MFGGGFGGFGGGFPFGGHGGHEEEEAYEKDTKLYDIMGLDKNADQATIRKTYKRMCVQLHPDKGGDPEKFKELQMANAVLSDPQKKEVYDKYGLKGIKEMDQGGHPGGAGMDDIFKQFFGGGGARSGRQAAKKCKPQVKEIAVKLEEIYSGKSFKIPISRKRVCESCNGQGGANVKGCTPCKGRGVVEKMVMLGPGMYQHVQQHCKDCGGEGKRVDPSDVCKECKGKKIFDRKKDLEVYVEPGTPDEHVMDYYGEGDEMPGVQSGDVKVVVRIQKHKVYQRKGADLFVKKSISLLEALTGFTLELVSLEGKKFGIRSEEGEVVANNETKKVEGKGLPFFKDGMGHGNLYVQFSVEMPSQVSAQHCQLLKQVLPSRTAPVVTAKEVLSLRDFHEHELNDHEEGGKRREEEEEEHGQGGVQCAQQ